MKYAIIECINGNFFVRAEGIASIEAAKVQYHGRCQALWNAPDVATAYVMIADEQLDAVEGCKEYIHHEFTQSEPEAVPEASEE
ncbi:MAG: hypothetical protein Q4C10_06275 [Clostridia bacterium]|nr:hypothetical protein [Clostridia bacterium]